jgi:hypothetical protein
VTRKPCCFTHSELFRRAVARAGNASEQPSATGGGEAGAIGDDALLLVAEPGSTYNPHVVDGVEEDGGVPPRLIKTDAGKSWQEGTPMTNSRMLPVAEPIEETPRELGCARS